MRTLIACLLLLVSGVANSAPPTISVNGATFVCKPTDTGGFTYAGSYQSATVFYSATLKFKQGQLIVNFGDYVQGYVSTTGGGPYIVNLYDTGDGGRFWATATITP